MSGHDTKHQRQPDVYVSPRYPVDEPPTYRAQCRCGWTGPERYRGITDADWDQHVTPAVTATDADRAKARELALLARSGVGGPQLREDAIAVALASERAAAVADLRARVEAVAEELEVDSRDAMKRADAARARGQETGARELYTAGVRHARVAHHAASAVRAAVTDTTGGTQR